MHKKEAFFKVRTNGLALQDVPWEFRNYELCDLAVTNNGLALEYVPSEVIDSNLCQAAVDNNGWAIQFIPECLIDRTICQMAVNTSPDVIIYILEKLLYIIQNFNESENQSTENTVECEIVGGTVDDSLIPFDK